MKTETRQMLRPDFGQIPEDLKKEPRWVAWRLVQRNGKPTKVPINAKTGSFAASNKPESWSTYDEAVAAFERGGVDGIGFTLGDGWTGIDLDKCRNPETEEIEPRALEIIDEVDSYTEISPSGTGVKIFAQGHLPPGGRRNGRIEMYASGRYFTVTGHKVSGDGVQERSAALEALHQDIFGGNGHPPQTDSNIGRLSVDDRELIERASTAQNGDKFRRLWMGEWTDYPSQSEADLALCSLLAFWTGKDRNRIDRLFRQSGLMREKWERADYRDRTIREAVTSTTEIWRQGTDGEAQASGGKGAGPSAKDGEQQTRPQAGVIQPGKSFTDLANAKLLARLLNERCLFVPQWGWLVWDGRRWTRDFGGHETVRLAGEALFKFYAKRALKEAEQRKELTKWSLEIQSRRRLRDILDLAKGYLLAKPDDFDAEPWLLNCKNGVLDLRTGKLSTHSPDLRLTKLVPVAYDPNAPTSTWRKFLQEIFLEDQELIRYVKRQLGYSVTGVTREHALVICWGIGANGKSTLFSTVRRVLGDYAQAVSPDLLLTRHKRGDTHPTVMADLFGARFCITQETDEDRRLDAARVKSLTGGDPVKGRFMNRDYFEFWPTHKLWLATNHRPVIEDTSFGMWRRISLIPFLAIFPEDKQDKTLPERLWEEREGILAYLVEGCLEWQCHGFGDCRAVKMATEEYKSDSDALHGWLEECCEIGTQTVTLFSELYENYTAWARRCGEEPLGYRAFGNRLEEKGFQATRVKGRDAARKGIWLKDCDECDGRDEVPS